MPLQLPNLDERRFGDLVEEARGVIPAWAPEWTNHNPSDPGITLIELFAYLAEVLLYRLNRVTDDQRRKFLKLLNGPSWPESGDLRDDLRRTVVALRERYRAVTANDYELLATEDFNAWHERQVAIETAADPLWQWWDVTGFDAANADQKPSKVSEAALRAQYRARGSAGYRLPVTADFNAWHHAQREIEEDADDPLREWWQVSGLGAAAANRPARLAKIARAHCVAQRNLDLGTEEERRQPIAGHVSVIAIPAGDPWIPVAAAQHQALWGFLDERRTVATRHHVVGPFFVPVQLELVVVGKTGVPPEALPPRIVAQVRQFMHPVTRAGGLPGWPFGRDVYVSELMAMLEAVDSVDSVVSLTLSSTRAPGDPASRVAGEPIWHADGDPIGIALQAHHLPEARVSPGQIVIVPPNRILAARFGIAVLADIDADAARLKREVKLAVRTALHPLHGGPGPGAGAHSFPLSSIRSAIAPLLAAGGAELRSLDVRADASRLERSGDQVVALLMNAGEVVDPRIDVDVQVRQAP